MYSARSGMYSSHDTRTARAPHAHGTRTARAPHAHHAHGTRTARARPAWCLQVILENFTSLGNVDPSLVSAEDIANFKEAWAAFDPDANSWMPVEQLPVLLLSIPPPMGLKAAAKAASAVEELRAKARAVSHCAKLTVPEHDGEVKFDEVP